ncbi:hypothetical protein AB0M29_34630 [Streptomyces sp. NPDC051976]|uniref:hypothetical protein n=1 Tax=Streptomyces sp. NPDC051976 TaxID=3154947 RepID=UPI0034318BFA
MRTPVSGEVFVHYGQLYVESDAEAYGDLQEAFAGQQVGLCGGAEPGFLFLLTGLHTGSVGFSAEIYDRLDGPPPVDLSWEEVVEVPFRPLTERTVVSQWAGERVWDLDLTVDDYRVRYSGTGMQAGQDHDTRCTGEPSLDRYLLQFWPSAPHPAELVKQTSAIAAYWHTYARELPPPTG